MSKLKKLLRNGKLKEWTHIVCFGVWLLLFVLGFVYFNGLFKSFFNHSIVHPFRIYVYKILYKLIDLQIFYILKITDCSHIRMQGIYVHE